MRIDLTGRTAIVTGAARGIGTAIAGSLAGAGATVVLADRDLEPARAQAARIGAGAHALAVDVTDEESVTNLVGAVTQRHGGPHILVNNAGISLPAATLDTSVRRWEQVVGVNLTGPFLCARTCLPAMQVAGWGRIVNLCSFAGKSAPIYADNASYAAAKAGLTGLIHNLAVEFAAAGVTVNGVAPGIVDTELLRSAHDEARRAELAARIPAGRFTTPEEVASLVTFLCAPQAAAITGEIVDINGGLYLD
ncbi:3-oxoacyl-[acyl-carrier-protein] reductase FabG [Actinocatenispora thailandica]|uniref:3-oxoacyl-[acyl-carrier-protein] reductase FabG n=1 Tax=Actinocatenispora thailandica TaxID=227318 RepID=A0A7R7DSF8_9ACTN|nr:SDR family NAD(P)-dependent oxidoreductase [Actinocatenispora thailandica]BCJ37050.1 3-oxoacyl-[acyl-carrier-protein] reductase FabG [Actinocatenispora thailandica]